jgi:hypothetical protein
MKRFLLMEFNYSGNSSFDGKVKESILKNAIHACKYYVNSKTRSNSIDQKDNLNAGIKVQEKPIFKWGENNNSSVCGAIMPCNESDISTSNKIYGLSAMNWQSLLELNYVMANHTNNSIFTKMNSINLNDILQSKLNKSCTAHVANMIPLLRRIRVLRKQFDIDGMKNIWIVKAPDVSRGVGMQLLYRLEDILECERGMSCRTVQKYIENPLLSSSTSNVSNIIAHRNPAPHDGFETIQNFHIVSESSKATAVTTHDHISTSISNKHQMYEKITVGDLKINTMDTIRSSSGAFPYRRKNRKSIKKLSFLKECIQNNGMEGKKKDDGIHIYIYTYI